jgi:DNA-binding MarR family transcriptional regulator
MDDPTAEPDYASLSEFRYAIRRFLRFSEDAARAAGLEPQQHQLLLTVKGVPGGAPARIGDIAERLLLRHNSTVELVDRLEASGYVERYRLTGDRRQVFVRLTPKGDDVLRTLSIHHRAEIQRAGPALVHVLTALIQATSRAD